MSVVALKQWARVCDSKENQLVQMKLKVARLLTEKRELRAAARDAQRDAVGKYRKLLVDISRVKFKRQTLKKEARDSSWASLLGNCWAAIDLRCL